MFRRSTEGIFKELAGGIRRKTLVYGNRTLMAEFLLKKDSFVAEHSHPHEQTGYIVSGRLKLVVGGEEFIAEPGDSWCIEAGVEHSAEALDDSLIIEVFSPVRDEFK